jgi:hypothetical protein
MFSSHSVLLVLTVFYDAVNNIVSLFLQTIHQVNFVIREAAKGLCHISWEFAAAIGSETDTVHITYDVSWTYYQTKYVKPYLI